MLHTKIIHDRPGWEKMMGQSSKSAPNLVVMGKFRSQVGQWRWTRWVRHLTQAGWNRPRTRRRAIILLLFSSSWLIWMMNGNRILQLHPLSHLGFGEPFSWKGGPWGRRLDNTVKHLLFHLAVYRHSKEFRRLTGYALPSSPEASANQVGTPVLLQAHVAETLERAHQRRQQWNSYLLQKQQANNHYSTYTKHQEECPPLGLLQPNVGPWYRPLDSPDLWQLLLVWDRNDIDMFLQEQPEFEDMYSSHFYQQVLNLEQKVQLWAMAVLLQAGGIFVAPSIRHFDDELLPRWADLKNTCQPRLSIQFQLAHHSTSSLLSSTSSSSNPSWAWHWLLVTPRHPYLACFWRKLQEWLLLNAGESSNVVAWNDLRPLLETTCLQELSSDPATAGNVQILPPVPLHVHTMVSSRPTVTGPTLPRFQVHIEETTFTPTSLHHQAQSSHRPKDRWSDRLRAANCAAGWLCDRCLRLPWRGSLESCQGWCRSCYSDMICGPTLPSPPPPPPVVNVQVHVTEKVGPRHQPKRIPCIIHQTWWEELTASKYPHLHRQQNSWKAAGWDYRFYTDEDAGEYIASHFPQRFLSAYQALVPGAFKADFFRLLVLLREGGIYADIDVQLEADLDHFVTPELAFLVARDVPIDYWPHANYCLWNGLMGAAPGHPFIAQAVEDLINRVQRRQDGNDIQSELCRQHKSTEIWKLRSIPILLLTGPCALGMSINAALGRRNVLEGFEVGWLSSGNNRTESAQEERLRGDALILLADRYDLGELRLTDIDRNLLVASSNQDRFVRGPVSETDNSSQEAPIHYSKSESDIVGEHGVYRDDQVLDEIVRLQITYDLHQDEN